MNVKSSNLQNRLQYALECRGKRAVDLANALDIPRSAISQYLSGKSQKMDSERLFAICRYLNVSEPWMLGYDVPMNEKQPIAILGDYDVDGVSSTSIFLKFFRAFPAKCDYAIGCD